MSSSKTESIKKPFRSIKLRSKVAALKQKGKTQNVVSLKVLRYYFLQSEKLCNNLVNASFI